MSGCPARTFCPLVTFLRPTTPSKGATTVVYDSSSSALRERRRRLTQRSLVAEHRALGDRPLHQRANAGLRGVAFGDRGLEHFLARRAALHQRLYALRLLVGAVQLDARGPSLGLGGCRGGAGRVHGVPRRIEIGPRPVDAHLGIARVEAHQHVSRAHALVALHRDLDHVSVHPGAEQQQRRFDEGVVGALDVAELHVPVDHRIDGEPECRDKSSSTRESHETLT